MPGHTLLPNLSGIPPLDRAYMSFSQYPHDWDDPTKQTIPQKVVPRKMKSSMVCNEFDRGTTCGEIEPVALETVS